MVVFRPASVLTVDDVSFTGAGAGVVDVDEDFAEVAAVVAKAIALLKAGGACLSGADRPRARFANPKPLTGMGVEECAAAAA